ncbi:MAG TPA: DUF5687 family protein [Bacteroidales bacterium]|nr:DUF5687 family protein [Bacteroidales bacterium]
MINLLIHHWKEKQRSPFWQKSIALNIILGILCLYLLLNVLALSFFADKIIQETYKGRDVVETFTGLLFYYFSFDLVIRFLFQQLPTLSIQPYLTLPIKKSKLLHYPLIKSGSSFFNIVAILILLPFFIKVVCATHSFPFCFAWIVALFSFIIANNYLNFLLKKYFAKRPLLILLLLAFVGLFIFFDIAKIVSCSSYFSAILIYLANTPFLIIIPVALAALTYYLAYFLLKKNSYVEDKLTDKRRNADSFLFLKRFGEIGDLVHIEIKMILRNKRPKSLLYFSLIFLAYGFMFYKKQNLDNYLLLSFVGVLMTAMFALNHGQFMFAWESSFFDSFMTKKISPYNYVKSKYLFFTVLCLLSFIVSLPYALISYKIGIINVSLLLYNVGVSSFILIFFGTYNSTRIDLGKSQFMNYQGIGATQFLLILPIMGIPVLVYLLFNLFDIPQYSFYVLGILGIIGIAFNKYLLQLVTDQFIKRKYKMAYGFRQK